MIKIVNIKTGAIVAAYQQHAITEFDRSRYVNAQSSATDAAEKSHNDVMVRLSNENRQMEVQARSTLLDLNGFFGALPGTAAEPHGYVMVLTGRHDIYGEPGSYEG